MGDRTVSISRAKLKAARGTADETSPREGFLLGDLIVPELTKCRLISRRQQQRSHREW